MEDDTEDRNRAARGVRRSTARAVPCAAAIALCVAWLSPTLLRAAEPYREPFRPQFHFSPAKNWTNDPNGLVFFDGEYHLFYQHNPFGDKWGHMSWGHAVSRDLVSWEHLPVAISEENGVMIFSGSAVVDRDNTSGFGQPGKPPLVAIYTGHYTTKPLQNQHIAFSTDRGRTWTKFSGNPVLDIGERDFRDPKVLWHEPTKRWVMTVAWPVQHKVRFYASPDLKAWTHLSDFGPAGATEGVWECPDLFPIDAGGKTRWVLIVNIGAGAPAGGSGCQYFVGDFDSHGFNLDPSYPSAKGAALWADYAPDFYAAVSWSDVPRSDGRRLWLGWMSNWQYANDVPTSPWRNAMSIPRELRLSETADGLRLAQAPARELEKLRGSRLHFQGGTVEELNAWLQKSEIAGYGWELGLELGSAAKGKQGVKLFRGAKEEIVLGWEAESRLLSLDRRSGGSQFHPKFAGVSTVSLPPRQGPVKLRLFIDACSIEVFVNDGERVMTELVFPPGEARAIERFAPDPHQPVGAVDAWSLRSIWRP
jgi:fructan beta-fructosidase